MQNPEQQGLIAMPVISIEINEQQEARIVDFIQAEESFTIQGGDISFDGKDIKRLKSITFEFKIKSQTQ